MFLYLWALFEMDCKDSTIDHRVRRFSTPLVLLTPGFTQLLFNELVAAVVANDQCNVARCADFEKFSHPVRKFVRILIFVRNCADFQ